MALGQLVGGPVSDARGRRTPLLLSLIVLTLASVACAISPSIQFMMVARFVQSLSGGWAMVTARAVVVDLAEGAQLVRSLNLIAGVGGIAPIVGPLVGAVILQLTEWRVSFWVVALLGALMLLAAAAWVPESLPVGMRHRGGLAVLGRAARHVSGNRAFVAHKTGALAPPLSLDGQPAGPDPDVGDVGYYAPGNDVVLYCGDQSYYDGIIVLGHLEGDDAERIAAMKGTITATVDALTS